MILTELERKIMTQGNPPHLQAPTRRSIDEYTEEEKSELVRRYTSGKQGYETVCAELGWYREAARNYLYDQGVMRKKKYIPPEHYSLLKKLLSEGYSAPAIAKQTGWTLRQVRSLKENLRKRRSVEK